MLPMFNEKERFRHRFIRLIENFNPSCLQGDEGKNYSNPPTEQLSYEFIEIRKAVSEVITGRKIFGLESGIQGKMDDLSGLLSSEGKFHGKQGQNELTIKVCGKLPTSTSKQCLDITTFFTLSNGRIGKHIIYGRNNLTIEALYYKTPKDFFRLMQIIDNDGNVFGVKELKNIRSKNRVIIPNTNIWILKYLNREQT
jgi:hypothetical protein